MAALCVLLVVSNGKPGQLMVPLFYNLSCHFHGTKGCVIVIGQSKKAFIHFLFIKSCVVKNSRVGQSGVTLDMLPKQAADAHRLLNYWLSIGCL